LENSRTKRGDVLNLQELEAVLEHMEMLQAMSESLREQQFQAILELGVELQDILRENQKAAQCLSPARGKLGYTCQIR
jgi:proline dehydrogenase